MKKNITINLFGTLYNIDEDAYQLLDSYLQSMKRYFGRREGGEEIANDIEHRVAELLWAKKEQGMEAVNLDVIKEIIDTIGNAEEIAGVDKDENGEKETSGTYTGNEQENDNYDSGTASPWQRFRHYFRYRRLYRDPNDKMLGGVCSGLSYYIGFGDPVLWRLLLLLAFLAQGFGLIAYLIMWLIVPEARTPEDRLKMKGIQPTPDNLNKQILQEHTAQERGYAGSGQSNGSGCLKVLLGLLLLPPLLLVIFIIGIFTSVIGGLTGGALQFGGCDWDFIDTMVNMTSGMVISGIVCILVVLVICVVLLVRWLFGSRKPMRTGTKWTLFAIVILGILWAIFSISHSVAKVQSWLDAHPRTHFAYSVTSARPKPKPQPHLDVPYLNETGFHIVTNSTIRCTWSGDYPTGDGERRYLDACDYDDVLAFTAERQDTVKPGVYDLYALARAEDDGAFVYANTGGTQMLQAVPAEGNKNGNLWKWACGNATIAKMQEVYPGFCPDSVRQQIAATNDSQGFGWSVVSIKNINVGGNGIIAYGISTDPAITKEDSECDWVSATDFVLVPAKGKK